MIFKGIYNNGTIVLDEKAPFVEGQTVEFEVVPKSPPPPKNGTRRKKSWR